MSTGTSRTGGTSLRRAGVGSRVAPVAGAALLVVVAFGAQSAFARKAVLVAAGDIACRPGVAPTADNCRQADTAALVRRLQPDVVATLGDAQYETGRLESYLGSYDLSWGAFRNITRPALGNHEYLPSTGRRRAPGHFDYFGRRAGPRPRGYYTYRRAGWRIVVLNSGALDAARRSPRLRDDCFPVSCRPRSRQVRWLTRIVRRSPRDGCLLAYWHHPRYSSTIPGPHGELRHVFRALYRGGAELALAGHSHTYERFDPMDAGGRIRRRGLRQFVVGTGGAGRIKTHRRPRHGSRHLDRTGALGVLELTLRPGRYAFRFVREDGAALDRGRGRCHRPPRA